MNVPRTVPIWAPTFAIDQQAGERSGANAAADAWKASEIRHAAKIREANRSAWQDYSCAWPTR